MTGDTLIWAVRAFVYKQFATTTRAPSIPAISQHFGLGVDQAGETLRILHDKHARDLDLAFMRNNPEGVQTERWFHLFGCRGWLTLRRDTRADEVL